MSWEGYGVKQSMRAYLKNLSDIHPVRMLYATSIKINDYTR